MTREAGEAAQATLALLSRRAPGATICPSEVARLIGGAADGGAMQGWRAMMPAVHAAVDQLVGDGRIELSWKGRTLSTRAGPYRIGRGARSDP